MNIASIKPADRAKAAVLVCLIVVITLFLAHTIMASVSPAAPAGPTRSSAAPTGTTEGPAQPGAAVVPPGTAPAPAPAAPDAGGSPFPMDKVRAATSSLARSNPVDVRDPFIPLTGSTEPIPAGPTTSFRPPRVATFPAASAGPLPVATGLGGALAGLPSFASVGSSPLAAKPQPEPEIQVVGLVSGPPSVATVRVEDRTVIARPGDLLARGYRVTTIGDDGVRVVAKRRALWMRVGAILNEKSDKPAN